MLGGGTGRGPAGPPPPNSWLQEGDNPPRKEVQDSLAGEEGWFVYEGTMRFPPIDPLPGLYIPDERSLRFQTLKSLATHWEWYLEHDRDGLASLPMKYKERLLYFMANYNPGNMTRAGLEVLFLSDTGLQDATVTENLTHLDLGTSVDLDCSLYDLIDIFGKKSHHVSASNQEPDNLIVPDAWDAPEAVSFMHYQSPSFSFLTHLSLAHPVRASWKSLLCLASHLKTLTHLSLAYWPAPSFRPVKPVKGGGTWFGWQSKLSGNGRHEAPNILRRLSRATYCLKWLDLTGCCTWLWALQCADGPDWAGSWRGVQMVKVGQDGPPDLAFKSGVDHYIDYEKPKKNNIEGSYGESDWWNISKWVWYVGSLAKLEGLVNQLRMAPPTARGWLEDGTIYDGQLGSADLPDLSTTTATTAETASAPDYKWWRHDPTDEAPIGACLEMRSEGRGSDGRVVFESSPDERLLIATLIEMFHSRGERIESVNFE